MDLAHFIARINNEMRGYVAQPADFERASVLEDGFAVKFSDAFSRLTALEIKRLSFQIWV